MLLIDHAQEVAGVTLYRDHLVPSLFHYLPGPPRLRRFELVLFRGEGGRQGGLLTLDVDLRWPDERLEAVRAALSEGRDVPAQLAPVLFSQGNARLVALGVEPGESGRLVEAVHGTAVPSLQGGQRAIFAVELPPEGASLLAAAAAGEPVPLVVVYELVHDGLMPARDLSIEVDYAMGYDFLRTQLAFNALWFKADLDRVTETLRREGHVKITTASYATLDAAGLQRQADEANATAKEVVATIFFRPAASPQTLGPSLGNVMGEAWGRQERARAAFVLRVGHQEERSRLTYDLREASVQRRTIAPQGMLVVPADGGPHVRTVDLDREPLPQTVRAFVVEGADWAGVSQVVFDLRQGEETRSLVLTPESPAAEAVLAAAPIEHRVRVLRVPEEGALGTPPVDAEPPFAPLERTQNPLDPAVLAGRRVLTVALGVFDPDVVRALAGELRLGDAARAFLLDAETPEVKIPLSGPGEPRLVASLILASGQRLAVERPIVAGEQTVLVHQPTAGFHLVQVELVDPLQRLESVIVEIEGADGGSRRALAVDAATPVARWSAPQGLEARWRHRDRLVARDGGGSETGWIEAEGSLLVVGDLEVEVGRVDCVMLGARPALGVMVTLTSVEPAPGAAAAVERFVAPDEGAVALAPRFRRGGSKRYRVDAVLLDEDGTERRIDPFETADEVLLLTLPGPA